MWIRSQNKRNLVDVKSFYIQDHLSYRDSINEWKIAGLMCEPSIEGALWILGKYKTKGKALKVLDELQCRIARTESGVYQMPEDDE